MKPVAAFISLFFAMVAFADEYRDPVRRFTIRPPVGWIQVDKSNVQKFDDAAGMLIPDRNFKYIAAFTKNVQRPFEVPYVLVQETNVRLKGGTYDAIERSMGAIDISKVNLDAGVQLSDLLKNFQSDQWVVDRSRNRMMMNLRMTDAIGGKIMAICTAYFGEESIVQINCYALEDQFATFSPEFEAINGSFRFDSGAEFCPVVSTSKAAEKAGAIGQLFGIVLALVIGFIVFRKFRRAPIQA